MAHRIAKITTIDVDKIIELLLSHHSLSEFYSSSLTYLVEGDDNTTSTDDLQYIGEL